MFLDSAAHGTARLVTVGAVAVAASGRRLEYLREVVADFFRFHVEGAEAFDARSVDKVAPAFESEHLGEGGGVHALVVGGGYFARPCRGFRQDDVDEGGFAYARMARKQGDAPAKFGLEEVDARALCGRHLEAGVADGGVEADEAVQVAEVGLVVSVRLVEYELYRNAIGFGRGQKTVDEGGRSFGIVDGDDEQALVEVGGDDVRLFRQVGGTADDVVTPVFNLADESRAFPVENDLHVVSHSHRIGAADALQAEGAPDFALDAASVLGLDEIPVACVLDDKPFHWSEIGKRGMERFLHSPFFIR